MAQTKEVTVEMEKRGQNENYYRKESAGLRRQLKMEKEGGIQNRSKDSGLGVGLLDLANKNIYNIWDILILKYDYLSEIQIQYLIFNSISRKPTWGAG